MKVVRKIVFIFLFVFSLFLCVSCGEKEPELSAVQKMLSSKVESPSEYEYVTSINYEGTVIYTDTTTYKKNGSDYDYEKTVKSLNDLLAEEEYTTTETSGKVTGFTGFSLASELLLEESYIVVDTITDEYLSASITEQGLSKIVNENAIDGKIELQIQNGKIVEIRLTYCLNDQYTAIVGKFTY